ncbi:MAG: glycosyltransferase family 4 protein [Planctomycetes bacterium]|nr:glycosyltransferase family 4 protein [Planctomycetota bacterium]
MAQDRKIRILQVSSARVYGGNEEHIRTLVKYLDRDVFDVFAAAPKDGEFAPILEKEGVQVFDFHVTGKFDFSAKRNLRSIIGENTIDIIHAHNRREDLVAALAARKCGGIAVTTIHDRINMKQDGTRAHGPATWVYNYLLRHHFHKLITVSEATRDDAIAVAGVAPDKIVHVVNGMDLERLDASLHLDDKRAELGLATEHAVSGMVARVRGTNIGKKGHRYFIEAAAIVARDLPNARFVIVGEDDEARELLSGMAEKLGVRSEVIFLGYRTDILEVMSTFDVVVLPSLFEGLPRTLMEGMALGKPAVGTRVDGIMELIVDGETGILVDPEDSRGLAIAMGEVLSSPDKREEMGAAAAERIRRVFDGRIMARETGEIYRALAGTTG